MSITLKTKTALGETRLLVLGGNILLGFQFNGVFQQEFDKLPAHARTLDGVALVLMVCAIALLVAPSMRHRIAERGRDSHDLLEMIRLMAALALLPFAFSLGLDIFIIIESVLGTSAALAAGLVFSGLAVWFWFGLQLLNRAQKGRRRPMPSDSRRVVPPLTERIEQMLTEARLIIPGAQALFGFQLIIPLTRTFADIPAASKLIHVGALGCMALAVVLLMAPAAYHRLVYDGEDTMDALRTGSLLVTMATIPLALGIAADVYVTIEHISASPGVAALTAALMLAVLTGLWHVYPLAMRYRRAGRSRRARAAR
jgi:uncharacterized protein DUF6328